MSYSIDFRKRALEYLDEGHTVRETAKTFKISPNTLSLWIKRRKETGNIQPKRREYKSKLDSEQLIDYLTNHPDAYQSEIAAHFGCTAATVCIRLKKLGYSRKKKQKYTKSKTPKK